MAKNFPKSTDSNRGYYHFVLKRSQACIMKATQNICKIRGAWVAQWVEHLTSAQVMISPVMSWIPTWGFDTQSLEPASDSVFLSVPPLLMLCLFLQNK